MVAGSQAADCFDQSQLSALLQAIHGADIFILYQTTDLVYRWAENLPKILQNKWHLGCTDNDFFPSSLVESMKSIKSNALTTGKMQIVETRLEHESNKGIWYKLSIDCHRDNQGKIIGIITTGINISELRRREQMLKILLREVSHRSKNLLAIIQSIASQTARHADSIITFLKKFQGRIQSISHSQDLVTDSDWRGAQFRELVLTQASGHLGKDSENFRIVGADPYLFPNAALHIGLALHELISNSMNYGALSQSSGKITISSKIIFNESGNTNLVISWNENFIPRENVYNVGEACFGRTVLEKIVPVAVNGKANLIIFPDGVIYNLSFPDTYFDLF